MDPAARPSPTRAANSDFEIGSRELDVCRGGFDEHVGKDGKRIALLDDSLGQVQALQEVVLFNP
jgi:hypothetical protein